MKNSKRNNTADARSRAIEKQRREFVKRFGPSKYAAKKLAQKQENEK